MIKSYMIEFRAMQNVKKNSFYQKTCPCLYKIYLLDNISHELLLFLIKFENLQTNSFFFKLSV